MTKTYTLDYDETAKSIRVAPEGPGVMVELPAAGIMLTDTFVKRMFSSDGPVWFDVSYTKTPRGLALRLHNHESRALVSIDVLSEIVSVVEELDDVEQEALEGFILSLESILRVLNSKRTPG